MNLKPLGDRLVIKPIEQDDVTSTGIFLPETAKEKPQQGKVVAAGQAHARKAASVSPSMLRLMTLCSMPSMPAQPSSWMDRNT